MNSTCESGNTPSNFTPWKLDKSTGLIRLYAELNSLFESFAPEAFDQAVADPDLGGGGGGVC